MNATITPISTVCAACGMNLRDATDARTALDQACRQMYGYRHISALSDQAGGETRTLLHAIADNRLRGDDLRIAIFRLYELGFEELAKRIERRVGSMTVPQTTSAAPPAASPVQLALVPSAPSEVLRPLPFNPTNDQGRALDAIGRLAKQRDHGVVVVVGFAGVGKSSMILFIAHAYGRPIVITPTGKSALRVKELTGLDAMTIHRWIYTPRENEKTGAVEWVRKTAEEIEQAVPRSRMVVLDEASMVGPDVWKDIIAICEQHNLKLVCIGDGFQLPPIQPRDAPPFSILAPAFAQQLGAERVEMTEVLRQAQDSPIIRASMMLRAGHGFSSFRELYQIQQHQVAETCKKVYERGGVTICHRNVTRLQLNAGIRQMLGIFDEMPQGPREGFAGEPLLVRKNTYEAGVVNGEIITFPGWTVPPSQSEMVRDRFKHVEESARFGGITLGKTNATLAVEELHGRLESSPKWIAIAGQKWASIENFYAGDKLAAHISAQFGYALTCHASQGSQWPFVFIVGEPSVRFDEEEGRRWYYTAATRASEHVGVYFGNL